MIRTRRVDPFFLWTKLLCGGHARGAKMGKDPFGDSRSGLSGAPLAASARGLARRRRDTVERAARSLNPANETPIIYTPLAQMSRGRSRGGPLLRRSQRVTHHAPATACVRSEKTIPTPHPRRTAAHSAPVALLPRSYKHLALVALSAQRGRRTTTCSSPRPASRRPCRPRMPLRQRALRRAWTSFRTERRRRADPR